MSGKSRNGMGSIRQRADGRFEARYTGADGKQHSLYGKTSSEVSKKLRAATSAVDTGDWIKPNALTFEAWVSIWLRDYCVACKPSTRAFYESHARVNILPIIGRIKLTALTSVHIRRVLSTAQQKGLSPLSVKSIMRITSLICKAAVESELIKSNPADSVKTPSAQRVTEMHIIDKPQYKAFFDAADATPHAIALKIMFLSGLRIGELCGLMWDDVDFSRGTVTIRQQLASSSTRESIRIVPTKTNEPRTIILTVEALTLLRAQRAKQNENRIKAGALWIDTEPDRSFVFRNTRGRCVLARDIERAVRTVGEAIGIPGLHPHDLRHSYAVAALRAGIDVKTVQHNLGHANASMTMDVYAKYTEDAGDEAARKFSAWLGSI